MLVSEEILNRKGARKVSDIPDEVLTLLNQGRIESVNLTEWLAVNHISLLKNVLPSIGLENKLESILSEVVNQNTEYGMKAIRLIGNLIDEAMIEKSDREKEDLAKKFSHHVSDSVRCWAAYLNKNYNLSLEEKLTYIHPFAADHHFGVREISWMSIRKDLSQHIDKSIELLTEWAQSNDENIRRFSIEVIRPRGVWTKHIEILKQEPNKALPILDLLKSDPSKYVQDSVGNWLNDASKAQPEWVLSLCEKWTTESDTKATARIVKKAKRTLVKNN